MNIFPCQKLQDVLHAKASVPSARTVLIPAKLPHVLLICRSMKTHTSAAPVTYLGHTPITARQGDDLCGGGGSIYLYGIQPFLCILFHSYFWGSDKQRQEEDRRVIGFGSLASMLMLRLLDSRQPLSLWWHHLAHRHAGRGCLSPCAEQYIPFVTHDNIKYGFRKDNKVLLEYISCAGVFLHRW